MEDWNITGISLRTLRTSKTNKRQRPKSATFIRRPSQPKRNGTRRRPATASRFRQHRHSPHSPQARTHARQSNKGGRTSRQHQRKQRQRPQHTSSFRVPSSQTNPILPPPPPFPSSRPETSPTTTTTTTTTTTKKTLQPSLDLLSRLAGFGLNQFYSDRTASVASHPTPATTTTTTTTTTPLFQNEASLRELQEALRIWLHEIDQTSFQSFAVFCEYKLRRSASQSSQWSSPNAFGTSVAWVCLMRAAESMPNYRGLFEALAQTIGPSIYCDYDQITTQLACDGGENDAWTLFDSETYYQRSKTMEREINQLRDSLTMMLDSSKQLKTQLTTKTMFSALGMASETFNHSSNYAVTLLARTWKQRQPPQQPSNQRNDETGANGGTGTIATVKEKISDLETVMRSISSMTNKKLEIFMTDVASYRNEFVSVHLLTDFFGTAPASSRLSFVSIFWRLLHHTEKEQLLNTIPIRSRDKNLRETLENILLESGLPHPNRHRHVGTNANETGGTTLEKMDASSIDDGKQPENTATASRRMTDTTLITFVKHACQSATIANESESREFLHRIMCALEMLRVGEQQMNAASIDLPNDPQNAIESKARDIVRLWHVEQDKCQKLQLALNDVKEELQETKTSVRTMARVQSKINEYNMSSSEIRSEENGVAVDLSIHGRKVVWPILHHTSHSRRHSLHRLIDCFYEEETLRTGGRSNLSTTTTTTTTTTHHMSLEEIHSAIASFYNVALLSAGVGSQMYSMAEIMKLHLVCEYGEPHMAIAHCQRIDIALRNFYQTDQRCHLFAMLCGSVEANSFLNRPETSQFVVTALAHMMKASVLDGIASVQDMFEMSNENDVDGNQANVFHCERAKMVVRNLFQMKGPNENNQLGQSGSDPAVDLIDMLSLNQTTLDSFLIEVTKVFCSTHELEIDMLKHVHDAMMIPGEGISSSMNGGEGNRLDYKSFVVVLPILGIKRPAISLADSFLNISGQEAFVDFVLDNTNRFSSGSYQPLIQLCTEALGVLLNGV